MVTGQLTKLTKSQWRVWPLLIANRIKHDLNSVHSFLSFITPMKFIALHWWYLCLQAVMQRLKENERWRAIGMLQSGSIQLSVARQL